MAIEYGNEISKMKVAFTDSKGKTVTQTFNHLKADATPQDIFYVATKIGSITTPSFDYVTKLSEVEIVVS